MIRRCLEGDLDAAHAIINEAAVAYRGVIPADRWHEPYMTAAELRREVESGVAFWGCDREGQLVGVMGLQPRGAVTLIRHAYVRPPWQGRGVGTELLRHLESTTDAPLLVGTWAAAHWAVRFYGRNGFRLLSRPETERLLRTHWSIPDRQIETSVVLAKGRGASLLGAAE